MNNQNISQGYAPLANGEYEPLKTYAAKTFLWMFAGLMTTFLIALAGYATGAVFLVFSIPALPFILLIAELGVVIWLSARIDSMSVTKARTLFFVYAALNGVVFSAYFIMFNVSSLILAFALSAGYFGLMAGIGYFTKADLSSMRPILIGGLLFLVAFWVLSIFLPLTQFERGICLVGMAVFMGFTAYDTQKIKRYHASFGSDPELARKASIFSALQLYLDFINLFLYVLRFVGKKN